MKGETVPQFKGNQMTGTRQTVVMSDVMQKWRWKTDVSFGWGRNNNLGWAAVRVMPAQGAWLVLELSPHRRSSAIESWSRLPEMEAQGRVRDQGRPC